MSLSDLIKKIDEPRQDTNLSSAIRVFVLEFYRSQVPEGPDDKPLDGISVRPSRALRREKNLGGSRHLVAL